MANLKEIRNRINSVGSTVQITNAMKMVSVTKLKKAQDAITAMTPYANKINELIQKVSASLENEISSPYTKERLVNNILIVPITSNKGLCGAFNTNIIKETNRQAATFKDKKVSVYTIGKKGNDVLKKAHQISQHETAVFDDLTFHNSEKITQKLMDDYHKGTYDKIILVYNHFINPGTQQVSVEQFLPILPVSSKESTLTDYVFEPSKEEIIQTMIPKALKVQLFKVLRDSFASEHAARMTAMHKATDNGNELKAQLNLIYNKARQAAITAEILEIVGGAEALNAS